jgi:DNA invertase Pin-like site-specific DNA recombinase
MAYAIAYYRTSSAANLDGDSAYRQDRAVVEYAKRAGLSMLACYWDKAVSGADPIETRAGFRAALEHAQAFGATIVVETANRFSRDLIVQETGFALLRERGVALIAADDPDGFSGDTPTATMVRQILGAVSQFEKQSAVDKLRGARDRASERTGRRVEGRKGHGELRPDVVREAKRLRRANPKTGKRRSFRTIAAELEALGHLNERGARFDPASIKAMVEAKAA